MLIFWVGDITKTIEVDKNPFSTKDKMFEALFYSPHPSPIIVPEEYEERRLEICNHNMKSFS